MTVWPGSPRDAQGSQGSGAELRIPGYTILDTLGAGGFGKVHVGFGTAGDVAGKLMAIKQVDRDVSSIEGFLDEVRISTRLDHQNIVATHEFRYTQGLFLLMLEFVEGVNLRKIWNALCGNDPWSVKSECRALLTPALAAYVVDQMCQGLSHAHSLTDDNGMHLGIVHRDISPDNVLATFDGQIKIIDFGLAKTWTKLDKTHVWFLDGQPQGDLKGKPRYMAPEQMKGKRAKRTTDIFAVGVVLFELLTGRRFHDTNDLAVVFRRLKGGYFPGLVQMREDIPAQLASVCGVALNLEPKERYQSAEQMGLALREWSSFSAQQGKADLNRLTEMMGQERDRVRGWRRAMEKAMEREEPPPEQPEPSPMPHGVMGRGGLTGLLVMVAVLCTALGFGISRWTRGPARADKTDSEIGATGKLSSHVADDVGMKSPTPVYARTEPEKQKGNPKPPAEPITSLQPSSAPIKLQPESSKDSTADEASRARVQDVKGRVPLKSGTSTLGSGPLLPKRAVRHNPRQPGRRADPLCLPRVSRSCYSMLEASWPRSTTDEPSTGGAPGVPQRPPERCSRWIPAIGKQHRSTTAPRACSCSRRPEPT